MSDKREYVFIPGNCPSLKNSKQIIQAGGRPRLIPSSSHRKYEVLTAYAWRAKKDEFLRLALGKPKPYKIGFYFVRDSRRAFDYTSPIDTCQDLMTKYGWITDDNMEEIVPVVLGYSVNKEHAGTLITVLE